MESNYYQILNINKDASLEEIKKAYKKLALKYHPDRNINNKKEAEKKFKEIVEAYTILSNENLRKKYDNNNKINLDFLIKIKNYINNLMENNKDMIDDLKSTEDSNELKRKILFYSLKYFLRNY
jgi:curved DNA-binding protein CbpA